MRGVVNFYKPLGMSSNTAVGRVKKILGAKKCGHTGTLDPKAEGVLPILLDKCTCLSEMLMEGSKEYLATLHLGHTTTTLDSEGEDITLLPREEISVTREDVQNVIKTFVGEIDQIPPMFSALSQNGVRLYRLAREGVEVERKPRRITIYSIALEDFDDTEYFVKIRVSCSKGTYIRTLADDIGAKLGCGAMLSHLARTKTGMFSVENAVTIEDLESKGEACITPIEDCLSQYDEIQPIEFFHTLLLNGQKVLLSKLKRDFEVGSYVRLLDKEGILTGLALITENEEGKKLISLDKRL